MSTPDQRARDKDRDAAIEVVEAAWADGQIVEADRDKRVEQLLQAQTLHEVEMLTHDLQLPVSTDAVVAAPASAPATVTAAQPPHPYSTLRDLQSPPMQVKKGRAGCGPAVLVAVIAAVGGLILGVVALTSSLDPAESGPFAQPEPGVESEDTVNVLSRGGYRDLLEDVEAATGSTEAFEGVLYPGYAVVYLPVDARSQRYAYWYWNGEMDDLDSRGTSSYERFDLADVDISVVVRLVNRVRGLVEEPTSYYAIVREPDPSDGAAIWAYASNEYSESAFISATPEGKVVYKSTS